jgi:hypothetical protein
MRAHRATDSLPPDCENVGMLRAARMVSRAMDSRHPWATFARDFCDSTECKELERYV